MSKVEPIKKDEQEQVLEQAQQAVQALVQANFGLTREVINLRRQVAGLQGALAQAEEANLSRNIAACKQ